MRSFEIPLSCSIDLTIDRWPIITLIYAYLELKMTIVKIAEYNTLKIKLCLLNDVQVQSHCQDTFHI